MIKKFSVLFAVALVLLMYVLGPSSLSARVQVGEEVNTRFETPHPYEGVKGVIWEQEFHWPEAGYIAIHFAQFDLAEGDYVEISCPNGKFSFTYEGKGKVVRNGEAVISEFWATHIPGDTAIVRLVGKNSRSGKGFIIDKWVRGFEQEIIRDTAIGLDNKPEPFSTGQSKPGNDLRDPEITAKSKAVVRLLIAGKYAGAGFLLGSEGHVMTSYDCIGSQEDADNTDYEFMAENVFADKIVEASSGKLVKANQELDYAMILLPENVSKKYGFLQFRKELPEIGENLYIPHQIGEQDNNIGTVSQVSKSGLINLTGSNPFQKGLVTGMPILSEIDHSVVALRCNVKKGNAGTIPVSLIVSHLGFYLPDDAVANRLTISAPPIPTVIGPTNNRCLGTLTPTFRWNPVAADPAVDFYKVKLIKMGTTNVTIFANIVGNVTQYPCPTTLEECSNYFWRVQAHNSVDYGAYSDKAYFRTPCRPPAPIPISPKDYATTTTTPTLTWTPVSTSCPNTPSGSMIYRIKIFRASTGVKILQQNNINSVTSYTVPSNILGRNVIYYWTVCACNSWGCGPDSNPAYFIPQ